MAIARPERDRPEKRKVSALFDVRTIIGALLGLYGVVLVLTGLLADSETSTGREGDAANLWVGVLLLLVGLFFGLWVRLRPVVVPTDELDEGDAGDAGRRH